MAEPDDVFEGDSVDKPMTFSKIIEPSNPNISTKSFGGKTSGFLNWNNTRFPYLYDERKTLRGFFWGADEVNMSSDKKDFYNLPQRWQTAYLRNIGLLATLDGPQTTLASLIHQYASDPAIRSIFATIADQESEHNHSYSYVLGTVVTSDVEIETFELGRKDPEILKRNKRLEKVYNKFATTPTIKNLAKAIVQTMILEGIKFYSSFAFFYGLSRKGVMPGTAQTIQYINREELWHGRIAADVLLILLADYPELNNDKFKKWIFKEFSIAVEEEKEWSKSNMEGIDDIFDAAEMEGYIEYRANKMLRLLSLEELYPENTENPMRWINDYTDNFDSTKTDFFEGRNRQYVKSGNDKNNFDDL